MRLGKVFYVVPKQTYQFFVQMYSGRVHRAIKFPSFFIFNFMHSGFICLKSSLKVCVGSSIDFSSLSSVSSLCYVSLHLVLSASIFDLILTHVTPFLFLIEVNRFSQFTLTLAYIFFGKVIHTSFIHIQYYILHV